MNLVNFALGVCFGLFFSAGMLLVVLFLANEELVGDPPYNQDTEICIFFGEDAAIVRGPGREKLLDILVPIVLDDMDNPFN